MQPFGHSPMPGTYMGSGSPNTLASSRSTKTVLPHTGQPGHCCAWKSFEVKRVFDGWPINAYLPGIDLIGLRPHRWSSSATASSLTGERVRMGIYRFESDFSTSMAPVELLIWPTDEL